MVVNALARYRVELRTGNYRQMVPGLEGDPVGRCSCKRFDLNGLGQYATCHFGLEQTMSKHMG